MTDSYEAALPARPAALLIRAGTVYTADAEARVISNGSILIVADRVRAVGTTAEVEAVIAALAPDLRNRLQTLNVPSMTALPGFVNSHWHELFAMRLPFNGALRSPSDRDDQPGPMASGGDLLRISAMFDSFYDLMRRLQPDEATAIARYSIWTQLRSGTTTLGDVGSFNLPRSMAEAVGALGIRCALSTWASDVVCKPSETRPVRTRDAEVVLRDLEDLLRLCAASSDRLRALPTAVLPANLSDELGTGLAQLCADGNLPFGTHVGSLRNEAAMMRQFFGTSPIRRLAELGLLNDRCLAAHTAFADEDEIAMLAERGVHITHSPAKYGSGGEATLSETGLITEFIRRGMPVSVCTDGTASPVGGMTEAMRAAWQFHNEAAADQTLVLPTDALAMATRVPAQGLRWDDEVGSLEPGKQADLVLVRTDDWRYLLNPRPLEAMLNLSGSADIDTVIVAGRTLVRDGRATHLDEAQLQQDYLAALSSFSERALGLSADVIERVIPRAGRPAEHSLIGQA